MPRNSFIAEIAPIVERLAPTYSIVCCSAVIAQAILESGWGESTLAAKYHNYFGIKCGTAWTGASVNLLTKEEYVPGTITDIRDNIRVYQTMEDGVRGYFDLLQLARYHNLRGITDPRTYLQTIKDDGYCTSSTYVDQCMQIIKQNDLTQYDGGASVSNMQKIADRMRYWCAIANLGYCWDHRWDIRDGGETDCSALYLFVLWECGYLPSKPTWGNTDTLRSQLEPLGFRFVKADNSKTAPAGVGLLRNGHVAVSMGDGTVAQASINELGTVRGGQPGDQTGLETKVSNDPHNWLWWIYPPDAPTDSATISTSTGGEKVFNFGLVKSGTKGDAVKVCQSALNARNGAGLHVDGSCGPLTVKAIRKWQSSHGLDDDGQCGQLTWNSLLSA